MTSQVGKLYDTVHPPTVTSKALGEGWVGAKNSTKGLLRPMLMKGTTFPLSQPVKGSPHGLNEGFACVSFAF